MKFKYGIIFYILWTFLFVLIPLLLVVFFSFTDELGMFTLNNIINTFNYSEVFLKSILLGAVSTVICLFIGYPVAYIVSKFTPIKQSTFIILIMIPMWMSFLLRTYSWMSLLENNGILNSILSMFNLKKVNFINTQNAVIFGMVYNFLPHMILPIYSCLCKMDKSIIEAAEDLGANKLKVFTKIILPLSASGITSGLTMVFVPSVSTFIISKMLGGSSNLLIGDLIEMQFLGNSYNPNLGSAISLILMIIILLCIGIMNQFGENNREEKNII